MPRIRTIKPEFFDDPEIAELSPLARLFFIGLWTQADREGRLPDDMRRLKTRLLPYDDVDPEALAVELNGKDMIRRYSDGNGHGFIWVRTFRKHQRPHPKEPASVIPECPLSAVKKNGEAGKNTASKVDYGLWTMDTGSLDTGSLENGARRPNPVASSESQTDSDFEAFRTAYPKNRRQGGKRIKAAFREARKTTSLEAMLAALEQHKRSEQWQDPKLIPLMTTWLHQERWTQELPSAQKHQRAVDAPTSWKCQLHDPPCATTDAHCTLMAQEHGGVWRFNSTKQFCEKHQH